MFLKSGWSNKLFLDPLCVEYLSVKEPLLTHLQNNKRRTAIYGLITEVTVMTRFSYMFDLQYRATAEVGKTVPIDAALRITPISLIRWREMVTGYLIPTANKPTIF